jgi:hypothetical protein
MEQLKLTNKLLLDRLEAVQLELKLQSQQVPHHRNNNIHFG